ncbi:MAG: hypothetical protein H0W29_03585 [Gemmatimonadales bacterium]|nr:hypothetical protein [Gemmatimonadales bacterium]
MRDMLPAAALEILDSMELESVAAHTRGCADCARLLEEYRAVAFALTDLLPAGAPPHSAALRARLLARAAQERRGAAESARGASRASIVNMWTGWTVAAAFGGVLLMHHAVHRPLDYGWLATGALTVILVVTAVYAHIQRSRVSALRARLTALESGTAVRDDRH